MNLEVNHLSVDLSHKGIVKDVSLKVEEGRFVGLIGPNGSGKSTLLKAIYKVLSPREGVILLNGEDLVRTRPRLIARSMAVVGQFNELDFDFTVREMVMMGRTPHKTLLEQDTTQDFEITTLALAQVDLAAYADRSYQSLSGGEKQRVVLARAIAQEPKLLVLDEPTNHLDIKYQLQVLSIVKKLRIGVLAALHDLSLAAEYCDYLYVLHQGTLVAEGEPEAVLTGDLIEAVYDVGCKTYTNPVTGKRDVSFFPRP
ncbi:MAG: ABC transporter ATP-binding protein [Spirochaetaceae bacterium]|jgi:iron complex transport system ATP-binding protein|nr:ABC transporter ATP-binding protein [Spirochaetaceae bacterium]